MNLDQRYLCLVLLALSIGEFPMLRNWHNDVKSANESSKRTALNVSGHFEKFWPFSGCHISF